MGQPGTSSYEVEKQRLEAETAAAKKRYRRDGNAASWRAFQEALAREAKLRQRWFG